MPLLSSPQKFLFGLLFAVVAACSDIAQPPPGQTIDLGGSVAKNTINGSVVLENLGACAGVKVQLLGPVNAVTLTTSKGGLFTAPDLQAAAYRVLAEAEGYAPYEGVFVFDARTAAEIPEISLGLETALVSGQVELSDGENPSGTSVAISGATDLAVPAGLNCDPVFEPQALFQVDAFVGADGAYQANVPRRGRDVSVGLERPGYTRERVTIDQGALNAGAVNVGTTVLYPLTGFVNVVGGLLHNSNLIDLQVSAFNGASHIALGVGTTAQSCDYGPWQSYTATPQMPEATIAILSEGQHTLCVKVRNAHNQQIILTTELFLDRVPPATPTLLVGLGQPYVTNGAQTLQILAVEMGSGLASVEVYDSLVWGVQTFPYSSVLPYNLVTQGAHDITAHVVDRAGNRSLVAGSTRVVFDTNPPSFTPPVFTQIDGNLVQIEVSNIVDISPREIRYGYVGPQTLNIAAAAFQPLDMASAATLVAALPAVDGNYTLSVQLRDAAGNLSAVYSSAVVVDRSPPQGISLNGPQQTNANSVLISLTGTDSNGLFVRLSEAPDFIGATWFAFTPTTMFTLSAGDGLKTIYAQFRDGFNNLSQVLLHGVSKDQTPPSDGGILIANTGYTQSPIITVYLSASDAHQVMLSESPTFAGADWESFSSLKTFTLNSHEGSHTIYAKFRDAVGNESPSVSDGVFLDLSNPAIPSVLLAGGSAAVNNHTTSLTLQFFSGDEVEMQISESSAFAGAAWLDLATNVTWQLSPGDGLKTIFVRVRDASGRISSAGQDSILVDTVGPGLPTIQIDAGATYSSDLQVDLALGNHSDAAEMLIGNDAAFTGKSWQAFVANTTYTLLAGDGPKTIYVKYRDALGNESPVAAASIILDSTAPSNTQISINANAAYTTNNLVTLSLFSEGASQMQLSENASFAGAAWQAYSTSYAYALTTGEGSKTIYARFRDAALNVTGPISDSIIYDATPPAGLSISINGGTNQTNNPNVALSLNVGDASEIQISQNPSFAGEPWITAVTSVSRLLTGGDGVKTLYMRARDLAGNIAATVTDGITLDTQGPTLTTVSINAGATSTTSTTVAVTVVDSGDSATMEIRNEVGVVFSGTFESLKVVALGAGEGVRTVTVKTWDALGNASNSAFDAIVVDSIAPSGAVQINNGAIYTTSRSVLLNLAANDLGTGVAGVKIASTQAALAATNTVSFDAVKAWVLPDAQGLNSVWLRFIDAAGNTSTDVSDTIVFDNIAPTSLSILANAGVNLTNNRQVQLAIGQVGGSEMLVSDDGSFAGAAWLPVTTSMVYNISGSDGAKTIYLKVRDAAGNVASPVTDGITLDTTPPLLTQVQLQNGALAFNQLTLLLTTVADSSAHSMNINDDNGVLLVAAPYLASRSITLSAGESADGDRTVFVTVADLAGNQSQVRSDNILIDRLAPVGSLSINNGAARSNTNAVQLALSAADVTSGVAYVQLSNSLAGVSAAIETPFETAKVWFLDSVDPNQELIRSVWARYRDLAGNYSNIVSDSIIVDRLGPSGAIDIALALTNQTLIAVDLTYDSDAVWMKLSNGNACAGGNWLPVATATLWTITGVPGLNEVSVQFQDAVGNIGACLPADTIYFDTIGPIPSSLSVVGNVDAEPGYSNQVTLTVTSTNTSSGAPCAGAEIDFDLGFIPPLAMSLGACSGMGGFPVSNLYLPNSDGVYDIFVRYRDSLGNYGPVTATTIILDRVPPLVAADGFSFVEGNYSNQNRVTLHLTATGASAVQVDEGLDCDSAMWQNVVSPFVFDLAPINPTSTLLADNFVSDISAANWIATSGTPNVNATGPVPKPSPSNALNLDNSPDAVISKNIAGYANYTYSYYWSRTAGPSAGEDLYFEYFDGSAWRMVNRHTNTDGSTSFYTLVSGALPPQTQQVRFRATGNAATDDYSVDNVVIRGDDPDGLSRSVAVRYRDQAGNLSACYTRQITVDTVAPEYSIALTGSDGIIGATAKQIAWVSASYAPPDVADIRLANVAGFFGANWTPFTALTSWVLDPGDGIKTVYGQIRDLAGNLSPSASTWIVLDQQPPQNPIVYINEPASVTNKAVVNLFTSAVGATQMRIANSLAALTLAPWQTYATSATADITGGANPRFVYVEFRDAVDNRSQVVFDSIDLDQTPPVPLAVTILGGTYINSVSVSLALNATDAGPITMVVSNDLVFNEAPQAFAPNITHLLPPGDGSKQVHVRFFDQAGNWADLSSNIVVLDTIAPTTPQLRTYSRSINADSFGVEIYQYSATDANFYSFELAGGSSYPYGFSTASYSAAETWFVFDLYQDAENVLQVRARDRAGNVSNIAQVVIFEDSTPPYAMTNIQVRNGKSKATIIWDDPLQDDIVGYYVHYGTQTRKDFWALSQGEYVYVGQFADQGDSPIWIPGGEARSFTLSGLPNGADVYITVSAVDAAGQEGPLGNEVRAAPNIVTPEYKYPPVKQLSSFGEFALPGSMVRNGSYYYLAIDNQIQVWSTVFPSSAINPTRLATTASTNNPDSLLVDLELHATNNRLYAVELVPDPAMSTGYRPQVAVFNVASPAAPVYITSVVLPTQNLAIAIESYQNRLYVATLDFFSFLFSDQHLIGVLDIAAPSQPTWLEAQSYVTSAIGTKLVVDNAAGYLYMTELFSGIGKYSLSGGGLTKVAKTAPGVSYGFEEILLRDSNYLYTASGAQLRLFDIAGSGITYTGYTFTATEGTSFSSFYVFESADIQGTTIYAAGSEGVGRFSVAVTNNIITNSRYLDPTQSLGFNALSSHSSNYIYGFDGFDLHVYNVTGSGGSIARYKGAKRAYYDIDAMEGLIVTAEGFDGVAIYSYEGGVPRQLSRINYGSNACRFTEVKIVQHNGYRVAYALSERPVGMMTINISDPYNPTILSEFGTCSSYTFLVRGLSVGGGRVAYTYFNETGTSIWLNKQTTVNPLNLADDWCSILATAQAPIKDVFYHNGRFFVANASGTDAYNLSGCTHLGEMNRDRWDALILLGNHLYYQDSSRIERYNIDAPAGWYNVGADIDVPQASSAKGLAYQGAYLYSFSTAGLKVIDDSQMTGNIVGEGSDPFGGTNIRYPAGLVIDKNWAIALTKDKGLMLWQLANPTRMTAYGESATVAGSYYDFDYMGYWGLLAGQVGGYPGFVSRGTAIFDMRGGDTIELLRNIEYDGIFDYGVVNQTMRNDAYNNQAFVGVTEDTYGGILGIYRVELDQPDSPLVTSLKLAGEVDIMDVDGNRAYIVNGLDSSEIMVFNISGAPTLIHRRNHGTNIEALQVSGGIAWIQDWTNGLLHAYSVRNDVWTLIHTFSGYTNIGNWMVTPSQLWVEVAEAGSMFESIKIYDLKKIYNLTGNPDIIATINGKGFYHGSVQAGSDIFSLCCQWFRYAWPSTLTTTFSGGQAGNILYGGTVVGPHILGIESSGGLRPRRFDIE